MRRSKPISDMIASLITILLGVISVLEAIRLYPLRMSAMAGDHTMPAFLGAIMILLGVLFLIFPARETFEVKFPEKETRSILLITAATLLGYWILMPYLGYMLTTLAASTILFHFFGAYRWKKSMLFGIITTVVVYMIFIQWLNMVMPKGILAI